MDAYFGQAVLTLRSPYQRVESVEGLYEQDDSPFELRY